MSNVDTKILCDIALKAGEKIMEIYNSDDFDIQSKADDSPITKADIAANEYICIELEKHYPNIPILSEERAILSYAERKNWSACFVVDPIDGTKEFIKRNGEFTVNIAYVENGITLEGVVYAPAIDLLYYTKDGKSYKKQNNKTEVLPINDSLDNFTVVISRSHPNAETEAYIESLRNEYSNLELLRIGSSLKLCMIAEGKANLYPRLGPTSEWDIAASHAVVKNAGGNVTVIETGKELTYNRENILNPYFIVKR